MILNEKFFIVLAWQTLFNEIDEIGNEEAVMYPFFILFDFIKRYSHAIACFISDFDS